PSCQVSCCVPFFISSLGSLPWETSVVPNLSSKYVRGRRLKVSDPPVIIGQQGGRFVVHHGALQILAGKLLDRFKRLPHRCDKYFCLAVMAPCEDRRA